MRTKFVMLLLAIAALSGTVAPAASAKIVKVLPHYLDNQGRHTLSPSLYERDAYQAHLRRRPQERSGVRFDVQWRTRDVSNLKLRMELRGTLSRTNTTAMLETAEAKHGLFSTWSVLPLKGDAYARLGELVAWRATLWNGDRQVAELKSFLW